MNAVIPELVFIPICCWWKEVASTHARVMLFSNSSSSGPLRILSPVLLQVVGCIYVESKTLRNNLMPIALNTLESIKGLLLDMARDSCLSLLQDVQERIALLQSRPSILDDYVTYQARLHPILVIYVSLKSRASEIEAASDRSI